MSANKIRFSGRNSDKDALRSEVWNALQDSGIGIGELFGHIPNFKGADLAAARLSEMKFWKDASVIKSNPDASQIPVRFQALKDGKLLYMPVPNLSNKLPFVELDPQILKAKGVDFLRAATIEGALEHGRAVEFDQMQKMDVLVVGCVAASESGGRTGKGAGFADLELGIFQEVGTILPTSIIVTTVHDLQIVEAARLPMQEHDSPLDWVITPTRSIETKTALPRPKGVGWEFVQADQYRDIPFLNQLRAQLQ